MVFLSMVKLSGRSTQSGQVVIHEMGKFKCIKMECPICRLTGSVQLFLNRNVAVTYARTRHYSHLDKDSHKPQFTYCKIEDLEALKTLLSQRRVSVTAGKDTAGQVGQGKGFGIHDPQLRSCAPDQQKKPWACSSVRTEHQPPKLAE